MLQQIIPAPLLELLQMLTGLEVQHSHDYYEGLPPAVFIYAVSPWGKSLRISAEDAKALLGYGPLPARMRYRRFTIPKKDGSKRVIEEPGIDLKAAQRAILDQQLKAIQPHQAALAYRRGKSIADHAWTHAGAAWIITADIEDFFPSTSARRVYAFWFSRFADAALARLFTRLTCYRGALPQGAPTSPALSNLINREMDEALGRITEASGGRYSRYADDMAFSWPDGLRPPSEFRRRVTAILRDSGYRLHPAKGWTLWRRRDEPEVTGLVLTQAGRVEVSPTIRAILRELEDAPGTQLRAGYEGFRSMAETRPAGLKASQPRRTASRAGAPSLPRALLLRGLFRRPGGDVPLITRWWLRAIMNRQLRAQGIDPTRLAEAAAAAQWDDEDELLDEEDFEDFDLEAYGEDDLPF